MEEGVQILLAAWTQDRVTFHGRHWNLEGLPVNPKPLQTPHPPLAVAATSDQSIAWAARNGFRLLSSGLGTALPALSRQRTVYRAALHAARHSTMTIDDLLRCWVVTKHVYVAQTDDLALREAEPYERWYLDSFARSLRADGLAGLSDKVRQDALEMVRRAGERRWENLVRDALLIGSAETVRARVAELQAAGVGELVCWMNFGGLPAQQVRESMRRFAEEVMPAFIPSPLIPSSPLPLGEG
jgi:alkanesulfonate monooxygenase SsuD/methylene tetrahydromethanopterin reductase-like flavin-dependent oxidoreductase (luciferase family)